MDIEVKTKEDYTIVQIGFDDDIRIDMQEKIKQLYMPQSPIKDFFLHYPFEIDQLEKWVDILDWEGVSSNRQVKWADEVIRKYQDKLDWFYLWLNESILCWNIDLLEEFEDKIAWDFIFSTSIDWNKELQDRFKNHLTPICYDYDNILKHTTENRNRVLRGSNNSCSSQFMDLYLYAKSLDEDMGIFILYDAIQEYFDSKIKEIKI